MILRILQLHHHRRHARRQHGSLAVLAWMQHWRRALRGGKNVSKELGNILNKIKQLSYSWISLWYDMNNYADLDWGRQPPPSAQFFIRWTSTSFNNCFKIALFYRGFICSRHDRWSRIPQCFEGHSDSQQQSPWSFPRHSNLSSLRQQWYPWALRSSYKSLWPMVQDRVNLLGAADSLSWLPQRCPKAYYNGRAEKNLPGWRLL